MPDRRARLPKLLLAISAVAFGSALVLLVVIMALSGTGGYAWYLVALSAGMVLVSAGLLARRSRQG